MIEDCKGDDGILVYICNVLANVPDFFWKTIEVCFPKNDCVVSSKDVLSAIRASLCSSFGTILRMYRPFYGA